MDYIKADRITLDAIFCSPRDLHVVFGLMVSKRMCLKMFNDDFSYGNEAEGMDAYIDIRQPMTFKDLNSFMKDISDRIMKFCKKPITVRINCYYDDRPNLKEQKLIQINPGDNCRLEGQ